ncbi:O-methyltransferase [Silvimonas sp. JCM 19000]
MNQTQWTHLDQWFSQLLAPEDDALRLALAQSQAAGMPDINVTANQGKLLHILARISGARRILEVGTLGGYSTIWLARALPADGQLVSLELNPDYARLARQHLAAAGVADRASVLEGPATQTLTQLIKDQTAPFDLIFIDANKDDNPAYLALSQQLSRVGTVIIGDNVVRQGRVLDASNADPGVAGMRTFLQQLAAPGLTSTAIQTVGSKGWDGFSISIVEKA